MPHEDGTVTEIARRSWPEIDDDIVHVHVSTTQPGRSRAWGLHQRSTDRLVVLKGLVSIVVYDGRLDSPTKGALNEFKLSERNPGIVVIPPNLYHGWHNLGTDEAFIVNMPTELYDYADPDEHRLPFDTDKIPFDWSLKHG